MNLDEFSIAKLDLDPRDVLIVRSPYPVSQEVANVIRDEMRKVVGDAQPILVLDGGLLLAVLSRRDLEAMG